jgi:anti-sigma regulatory factor (Ser/Thr protein kinase)
MTSIQTLLDRRFGLPDLPALRAVLGDCAIVSGLPGPRGEEFVLAAYELLAHAIEHGGGGQVLVHRTGGQLRCQVRDCGPALSAGTADGCGLGAAQALADQLDISRHRDGTTTTIVMNIPVASTSPDRDNVMSSDIPPWPRPSPDT